MNAAVTAAVLVIGDEILSGRTKDKNIGYIAERCFEIGIDLREVRIIPDEQAAIVGAVGDLSARHTYLFTTGGIGPTHDDITADAIANAFDVELVEDPRAIALLLERVAPEDLNPARRRMARIPLGADLVENTVSKAPGFWIGNVIVMAGVPVVMQAMFDSVMPKLSGGARMKVRAISAGALAEGSYATSLASIASDLPNVSIGSYPAFRDGRFHNEIVVRGKDQGELDMAVVRIGEMIASLTRRS